MDQTESEKNFIIQDNLVIPQDQWKYFQFFVDMDLIGDSTWPKKINLPCDFDLDYASFMSICDFVSERKILKKEDRHLHNMRSWSIIIPNRFKELFDDLKNIDINNQEQVDSFASKYLVRQDGSIVDINNLPDYINERFKMLFYNISFKIDEDMIYDEIKKKFMKFQLFQKCFIDISNTAFKFGVIIDGKTNQFNKLARDKFDNLYTMFATGDETDFMGLWCKNEQQKAIDAEIRENNPFIDDGEFYEPFICKDEIMRRFRLRIDYFITDNSWLLE